MVDKKKSRKPHEQMAVEITQSEKVIEKAVDDCRRVLGAAQTFYDKSTQTYIGTQTHEVEKVGKIMLHNGIETDKIMSRLRKEFKGQVKRGIFERLCEKHPEWVQDKHRPKDSKNKQGTTTSSSSDSDTTTEDQNLTPYQQAFADKVKNEILRDSELNRLTEQFTGLSWVDQGALIDETPKQNQWHKIFIEKSYNHMFELATSMSDSEINYTLNESTLLMKVLDKFRDVLLEQRELREKKDKMASV